MRFQSGQMMLFVKTRPNPIFWGGTLSPRPNHDDPIMAGFLRFMELHMFFLFYFQVDTITLKRNIWHSDGVIGEPVYVPRHGYDLNKDGSAEDDGYVLVQLYHPNKHRTDFCVLDAQNIEAGPVARIKLKHHVPYGFHGTFSPEVFLYSPVSLKSKL